MSAAPDPVPMHGTEPETLPVAGLRIWGWALSRSLLVALLGTVLTWELLLFSMLPGVAGSSSPYVIMVVLVASYWGCAVMAVVGTPFLVLAVRSYEGERFVQRAMLAGVAWGVASFLVGWLWVLRTPSYIAFAPGLLVAGAWLGGAIAKRSVGPVEAARIAAGEFGFVVRFRVVLLYLALAPLAWLMIERLNHAGLL